MLPFPMGGKREQGGAVLGMSGCHAARTVRAPPRYLQWRGGDTTLPRTGKCRAARIGTPYQSHPGKQRRNRYCQIAVLPSLLFAKSACRIDKPIGLSSLSYCQISLIARSAGC